MDTTDRIVNCYQNAAQDCDQASPGREAIEALIGLSLDVAWRRLVPNVSDAQITQMVNRYREHFIVLDQTPMTMYPGALGGLEKLKNSGKWLAIATGKSRRGMQRTFEEVDIEDWFVASRCGDETHSKPNPQMLYDLLDVTGMEVSQAVMIGDTTYDLQMAEQAGMASLAVSYGVHDRDQLADLASMGVVDSFPEVVQKLI